MAPICLRLFVKRTCKRVWSCLGLFVSGFSLACRTTTAESTFGGGQKHPGLSVSACSTSQSAWIMMPRGPYDLVPGEAFSRCATSFWIMTTQVVILGVFGPGLM